LIFAKLRYLGFLGVGYVSRFIGNLVFKMIFALRIFANYATLVIIHSNREELLSYG